MTLFKETRQNTVKHGRNTAGSFAMSSHHRFCRFGWKATVFRTTLQHTVKHGRNTAGSFALVPSHSCKRICVHIVHYVEVPLSTNMVQFMGSGFENNAA